MRSSSFDLRLVSSIALVLLGVSGCGSSAKPKADDTGADPKQTAADVPSDPPVVNPREVPPGRHQLMAPLKVYSNPPGCMVFLGVEVVRGEGDTFAQTPLEVMVSRGKVTISVEKPGGRRSMQQIEVPAVETVEFDVSSAPEEGDNFAEPALLNAPFFEASIGRPLKRYEKAAPPRVR